MVHDNRAAVADRAHRVKSVRRHDRNKTRTRHHRVTVDRNFELSFDNVPDLLVRMRVLVDRRPRIEDIMSEGHATRIKVTSLPTRQPLDSLQFASVDKRHRSNSVSIVISYIQTVTEDE